MWKGFQNAERLLGTPLILTWLELGETLYVYLVTFDKAISSVLIKDEEGNKKLIYFTSRML